MRDRGIIYAGLAVFLGVMTFPLWYNLSARTTNKGPEPKLPTQQKQCVAPVNYMRNSHMDLLIQWREQAVRQGDKHFTAFNGKSYTIALVGTCLNCHTDKEQFCDRCHNYAAVTLTCWNCHVDPKLAVRHQVAALESTGRAR
jgi:[DsrC]-trisulfide reductase subunit J